MVMFMYRMLAIGDDKENVSCNFGDWPCCSRKNDQRKLRCETKIADGVLPLPVPFMKRKKGTSQISLLGRCGRKKTQFSSSTIASDPCACTLKVHNSGLWSVNFLNSF